MKIHSFVKIITLAIALSCISNASHADTQDSEPEMVDNIHRFFRYVEVPASASIENYFQLFGENNESERDLTIRQEFPKIKISKALKDSRVIAYLNQHVYSNKMSETPSRFFKCLHQTKGSVFAGPKPPKIKLPSTWDKNHRKFEVYKNGKKFVFVFSNIYESDIQDVYLPDGKSIYALLKLCKKP